jgi:hypothetical protein
LSLRLIALFKEGMYTTQLADEKLEGQNGAPDTIKKVKYKEPRKKIYLEKLNNEYDYKNNNLCRFVDFDFM